MALEFTVGVNDQLSTPATAMARSMAVAAAQAKILATQGAAVEAALVKASALGASTQKVDALKAAHARLLAEYVKVAPAANAAAAAAARVAEAQAHEAAAAKAAKEASSARKEALLKSIEQLGIMREALGSAAEGAKAFGEALLAGDAGGAVKAFGETIGGAAKALDLLAPGLGQLVSAAIGAEAAVAGLVIGGLQKLVERAIESSDKVALLKAQLESLGGGASGGNILKVVDEVAAKTGQARDEVGRLARTFEGIGIHDLGKLQDALLASRASALISASGSSGAYETLAKKIAGVAEHGGNLKIPDKGLAKIAETGARATDVAAQLGIGVETLDARLKAGTIKASEFGDALEKALITKGAKAVDVAANSLDGIKNRFANSIAAIFDVGDHVDPLLEAFGKLADLFDQNTESGKAMHLAVEVIIDKVGELAKSAVPVLEDILIYTLEVALRLVEMGEHWDDVKTSIEGVALAVTGPFGAAVAGVTLLIEGLTDWGPKAYEAAVAFIDGLVNGIEGGLARVGDAAAKVAHSAVDAVEGALGIHSPSVVMMDVGDNVAQGMAAGMAANDNVSAAARDMGQSAYAGAGAAVGGAGGGGGGNHYHFEVGGLHVNGAGKDVQEVSEEALALLLERAAATQGLGTAAA